MCVCVGGRPNITMLAVSKAPSLNLINCDVKRACYKLFLESEKEKWSGSDPGLHYGTCCTRAVRSKGKLRLS